MAIAVGQMDRRISLYVRTQAADGVYGGYTDIAYEEKMEVVWAHVIWRGGNVDEDGDQMQNNQIVEFYVRNSGVMADANVLDYIKHDNKNYYIDSLNVVDGREKYLQILTTQIRPVEA